MEDYFVDVSIKLKRSTLDNLEKIVNYFNLREQYINSDRKNDPITVEQIIKGAIVNEIQRIETYNHMIKNQGDKSLGDKKYELKNRLKEILKERNMKQLDLCELTGIDKGNMSMICNNRNQPTADLLLRILVALDFIPLHELFYREESK